MIPKPAMRRYWTLTPKIESIDSPPEWISWEDIYLEQSMDFISRDGDHTVKIHLWIYASVSELEYSF